MSGWRATLIIALILSGLAACADSRVISRNQAPDISRKIKRVAVFPFRGPEKSAPLPLKSERIFGAELTNSGLFLTAPQGDVDLFFRRHRLARNQVLNSNQLAQAGAELAVDAIVRGRIDEAINQGRDLSISLQVEIIKTTGRVVNTTFLRRSGRDYRKVFHFGLITTESRLLQIMAREIIEEWKNRDFAGS